MTDFPLRVSLTRLLLRLGGGPQLSAIVRASKDIRGAQRACLRGITVAHAATAYGREHGFSSIRTIDDYRRAVPVNTYENLRPYIDRMRRGEADVLIPGKPLMYTTTSGTTDKPKFIPVSGHEFKTVHTRLSRVWFYTTMRDNPGIYRGLNLSMVGAAEEGTTEDGTPYGALSGLSYRNIPAILKTLYSVPYSLICIKDPARKYYSMLRFALARNITYIIAVNPATLREMHRCIVENWDDLLRDINDGTLRRDAEEALDTNARAEARSMLSPDPGRALALAELMRRHDADLRPRHYWPGLSCINTWKQGNCRVALARLDGYFPESTSIREFGYWASEAKAGIVLENSWEYSLLAAHVYHFEFIPEEERGSREPPVLQAHEVEPGRRYYLLFSTLSGLYRYDINDVVEVTGFFNQFPLFRFLYKGEGVTSLCGEKLSEDQILQAVKESSAETGLAIEFFTMICDEARLQYTLFAEFSRHAGFEERDRFIKAVDNRLLRMNPEWKSKRESRRLGLPQIRELPPDCYARLKRRVIELGLSREGQYKVCYLRRTPESIRLFEELAEKETTPDASPSLSAGGGLS
jgi:hypothetical protein